MSVNTIGGVNRGSAINNPSYVVASNVVGKFRDAFETFNTASRWNVIQTGSGDVVIVDGNAAAASYLAISKSPWVTGSTYIIESQNVFTLPVEVAVGAMMSQRTLGQEFSIELVSTDTPLPAPADIPIASISQTTTVLTVTTQGTHNLVPGRRIGIRDMQLSSSLNYPSLVVASIPTSNSFTATTGPGGTIPSLTTVAFTNTGSVYSRSALGNAQDGTSIIFENATATNASFYVRSEAGDVNPMGITNANLIANHSVTVGSTAPVVAINAANTYAFFPTTEYRLMAQSDRTQWVDATVDAQTAPNSRAFRSQISPSPDKEYKLRIRAVNNDSLTVPIGQIVSASKSGATTATVLMDRPHNLRVGEFINAYGVRLQGAAEFPNLTLGAAAVLSIVDANTFTVVWGTASTVTSYGGYVAKVQGGNPISALGAIAQVVQSGSLASNGVLTLSGNGTWAGAVIGDYVELIGIRDNTTGASLNVDGAWKVRNLVTSTLELEPLPGTTVPSAFGFTNCGGGVIKRTDLRLSYIRIFDFERQRIESVNRPASDIGASIPVTVNNAPAVTVTGTLTTVTTVTGVTTVSAVTNQTQAGGISMQDHVPALMRAAAQNVRRNISVS
jgi:hypothetical protein